ncbi:MAG: hypothetical protein M3H12_16335 [Chromatiales bacterium]|nr:hypothetical protein [Gammaproteobacteria bacterium]
MDTIVHMGAGRCSELDDYLAAKPAHLLLVEADPQLAEALQARTTNHPQVEVINRVVAAQPGPATFGSSLLHMGDRVKIRHKSQI